MELIKLEHRNFIEEFLKNFTSLSTRKAYKLDMEDFFKFCNGRFTHPNQLNLMHFISYRDKLIAEGFSSATISRKLYSIKSLMSWCVTQGFIKTNPVQELKLPKPVVKDPTIAFTDEEASKIMDLPDVMEFHGNYHKLMLVFLFYLALRRSELVNIKIEDIYEDRGITVLRVIGKGGKVRIIPLPTEVVLHLGVYITNYKMFVGYALNTGDYLFQSSPYGKSNKPINTNTVFKIVRKYAEKAGINKRVSPHSCRATVISQLLEKNVSLRHVADLAGHSNVQTTIGYDKKRDGYANSAAFKVDYGKAS
jgi:integrase/recombinase XerD